MVLTPDPTQRILSRLGMALVSFPGPCQAAPMSAPSVITFRAVLEAHGKTATGFVVPPYVVERLAAGKRPPVQVRIGSHTYRSSVAMMGGRYLLGVSAENRKLAGIAAGDEVGVVLELDTQPREVEVPGDFAAALDAAPAARRTFDALAYSHRLRWVLSVNDAKTAVTRERRIAKAIADLSA